MFKKPENPPTNSSDLYKINSSDLYKINSSDLYKIIIIRIYPYLESK